MRTWSVETRADDSQPWVLAASDTNPTCRFTQAWHLYQSLEGKERRILQDFRPVRMRTEPDELDLFHEETPMKFDVMIGWTMSDPDTGYSSFCDGYRPGARQHTETITVEWTNPPAGANEVQHLVETLADAVYYATNAPRLTLPEGLTGQVCRLIDDLGYTGREAGHYSLSIGDTVTVNEVTVECASVGWKRVTLAPAEQNA